MPTISFSTITAVAIIVSSVACQRVTRKGLLPSEWWHSISRCSNTWPTRPLDPENFTKVATAGGSGSVLPEIDDTLKIVYGQLAPEGRYKWMASLLTCEGYQYCAGTLIAPSVVLTASHCLTYDFDFVPDVKTMRVRVGQYRVESRSADYDTFRVRAFVRHPDYDDITLSNDLALIFLDGISRFTPIRLAPAQLQVLEMAPATIVGWGQYEGDQDLAHGSDELREAPVKVISKETCDRLYVEAYGEENIPDVPNIVCSSGNTEDGDGPEGTCFGDSGGPLVLKGARKDEDMQLGITSFGAESNCSTDIPSGYTDLRPFRDWIWQTVRENKVAYPPLNPGFRCPPGGYPLAHPPGYNETNRGPSLEEKNCACDEQGCQYMTVEDEGAPLPLCQVKGGAACACAARYFQAGEKVLRLCNPSSS